MTQGEAGPGSGSGEQEEDGRCWEEGGAEGEAGGSWGGAPLTAAE